MKKSRGDISIYLSLLVGTMILGSAVLIGLILARQITLTQDLVASERAYYAANAGVEEGFYRLARAIPPGGAAGDIDPGPPPVLPGTVVYQNGVAEYEPVSVGNHVRLFNGLCGYIEGRFGTESRFFFVGRGECL